MPMIVCPTCGKECKKTRRSAKYCSRACVRHPSLPHSYPSSPVELKCQQCERILPTDDFAYDRRLTYRGCRQQRCRACCKKYRQENAEAARKVARRAKLRKYGLTTTKFEAMLARQRNACAICRKILKPGQHHIDHDHDSQLVRGILCFNCNAGLGHFRDNQQLLKKAVRYLEATCS